MFPEDSTIVNEGDSFNFTCEYGKASTAITWVKLIRGNDKVINLPRNKVVEEKDPQGRNRIEVYVFKNVTPDDGGTYRCDVIESGKLKHAGPRVLQVIGECK